MEESYISYETALLAKEKKFKETCHAYYHVNEGYENGYAFCYHETQDDKDLELLLCPTQDLLQKWLREKYNIEIDIKSVITGYEFCVWKRNNEDEDINWSKTFLIYEEALEQGLYDALNFI